MFLCSQTKTLRNEDQISGVLPHLEKVPFKATTNNQIYSVGQCKDTAGTNYWHIASIVGPKLCVPLK